VPAVRTSFEKESGIFISELKDPEEHKAEELHEENLAYESIKTEDPWQGPQVSY
jgi:hypothetical protein